MSEKKEVPIISEEKRHYDTLISIYKYTASIIAILTGVAAWIIGGNLSQTKQDISNELNQLKTQINLTRLSSQDAIKGTGDAADKQIESLRKNTESFLNLTKDMTLMQISTLRENAKDLALTSAREGIAEAFKTDAIQNQVEVAAKKEIGDRLSNIVEKEMEKTGRIFDDFPALTSAYDRIRFGDRKALDTLDSLANFSDNPTIRRLARSYLVQKGVDYEKSIIAENQNIKLSLNMLLSLAEIPINPIITKTDSTKLISTLIKNILSDIDLYKVTIAFMSLKELTNNDIRTFDITAIRKRYFVK